MLGVSKSISGFDPRSIAGCLLWFDAADTSTITGTTTVTQWNSKGLNSTYASNYTGSCTSGNTYNGLNFIRCASGTEMRFTTALNTQARSWFAVARVVSILGATTPTYAAIVNQTVGNGQDSLSMGYINATTDFTGIGPSGLFAAVVTNAASAASLNTVFTISVVNSTTVASNILTVNGVSQVVASSNSVAASSYNTSNITYTIGTASYSSTIDIMEILFYAGDVTTAQRQQVEGYLSWKWALIPSLNPKSISGCSLWLDGADASTMFQDTAGATPVTTNGQLVSRWTDKSSNAFAFITGTGGTAPTYNTSALNSKSGVTFGSTESSTVFSTNYKWLDSTSAINFYTAFTSGGSNTTVLAVVNVGATNQHNILFKNSINLDMEIYYPWTGVGFIWDQPYNTASNRLTSSYSVTGGQLISAVRSGATMTGYSNGTSFATISTASGTLSNAAGTMSIGGALVPGGTYYTFNSNICEMLIYNRDLLITERQQVESYLGSKWGLSVTSSSNKLVSTHPFYTIQPYLKVFTPTDIAGCALWIDAADTSTITGTTTVTAVQNKVLTGSSLTTQGTASFLSLVSSSINSKPALYFNNSAANNVYLSGYLSNITSGTMFVVWQAATQSSATYRPFFTWNDTGSLTFPAFGYQNSQTSVGPYTTFGGNGTPSTTVTSGSNYLADFTWSGTTTSVSFNGATPTAGTMIAFSGASMNVWIGWDNGVATTMYLGELLLYNGVLTTAQRQQIQGYLSAKWGFSSTFPTTQPFKTTPPSLPAQFIATSPGSCSLSLTGLTGGTITWGSSSSNVSGYVWYLGTGPQTGAVTNGLIASPTMYTVTFTYALSAATSYYAWVAPYSISGAGTIVLSAAVVTPNPTLSASVANQNTFIASYSTSGNPQWVTRITGNGFVKATSMTTDTSGNVIVTGNFGANPTTIYSTGDVAFGTTLVPTAYDTFVVKYNSAGTVQWVAKIGGNANDFPFSITTDSAGNITVVGTYTSTTLTAYSSSGTAFGTTLPTPNIVGIFIVQYNSAGTVQWVGRLMGTGTDTVNAVATDTSGNIVLSGFYASSPLTAYSASTTAFATTLPNSGTQDAFIVQYNSAGAVQWVARIAGTASDNGYGVATDSSNNIIVSGYFTSTTLTAYNASATAFATTLTVKSTVDTFLVKYNSAGTVQWIAQVGGLAYGLVTSTDSSGNIFVAGYRGSSVLTAYSVGNTAFSPTLSAATGAFIVKYNSAGTVQWLATVPTSSSDTFYRICTDAGGSAYLTGDYVSTASVTLSNASGTASSYILPISCTYGTSNSQYIVSYTSAGAVSGAITLRPNDPTGTSYGYGVAVSGSNLYATGYYSARGPTTMQSNNYVYPNLTAGGTLSLTWGGTAGTKDGFLVKYGPYGNTLWAAQIAGTSNDQGFAASADSSGNIFVTGYCGAALTFYNTGGTTGATLTYVGGYDTFIAKYSSAGSVLWAALIGGTANDSGQSLSTDSSGNIFVTGYYSAALTLYNTGGTTGATLSNAGAGDVFLAKYSSAGSVLWATRIAGTGADYGTGVSTDSSGNVFVGGQYAADITLYNTGGTTGATLTNAGSNDGFIAKYSSAGAVLWAAQIASVGSDSGQSVATDSSGNVFVGGIYGAGGGGSLTLYNTGGTTGATLTNATNTFDGYIAKYSSAGAVLWAAQIAGTGFDQVYGVATDSSGNVFVVGVYNSSTLTLYNTGGGTGATLALTGSSSGFIAKYSSAGAVLWATRIAGTGADYGAGVSTDSSGNVFVTGYYTAALTLYNTGGATGATLTNAGSNDTFIAKYSSAGAVLWAAQIGGTADDYGNGVATDSSGNVFATGYYNATLSLSNAV